VNTNENNQLTMLALTGDTDSKGKEAITLVTLSLSLCLSPSSLLNHWAGNDLNFSTGLPFIVDWYPVFPLLLLLLYRMAH
jgi:hypothetical protein